MVLESGSGPHRSFRVPHPCTLEVLEGARLKEKNLFKPYTVGSPQPFLNLPAQTLQANSLNPKPDTVTSKPNRLQISSCGPAPIPTKAAKGGTSEFALKGFGVRVSELGWEGLGVWGLGFRVSELG